jgi:RimJ/RimL family protein N-acetyltransferase
MRPWQRRLPVLEGRRVILREVTAGDVPALLKAFASPETSRYITPPPSTRPAFERFVDWARNGRREARYLCFAVVLRETGEAVGVFQVWPLDPGFDVVEWGFVIGPAYWGTGVFTESARLMIEFMFRSLGAQRLEARSAAANARGNAALRKMGAVEEGLLRRCFVCQGQRIDHIMFSILAEEWRR